MRKSLSVLFERNNNRIYRHSTGRLIVETNKGHIDYPLYSRGIVLYDFPERIATYVRNEVRRIFWREGKPCRSVASYLKDFT